MVVTWVSLLKTVPWTDVIANAPAITEGARKLWKTVARKADPADAAQARAEPGTPANAESGISPAEAVARLQSRLDAVDGTVAELQAQMLASTELLKALADQNTELVARVEVHRRRLLWLSGALALAMIGGASAVAVVLSGS